MVLIKWNICVGRWAARSTTQTCCHISISWWVMLQIYCGLMSSAVSFDGLTQHKIYMCKDTHRHDLSPSEYNVGCLSEELSGMKNIKENQIKSRLKPNPEEENRPQYHVETPFMSRRVTRAWTCEYRSKKNPTTIQVTNNETRLAASAEPNKCIGSIGNVGLCQKNKSWNKRDCCLNIGRQDDSSVPHWDIVLKVCLFVLFCWKIQTASWTLWGKRKLLVGFL